MLKHIPILGDFFVSKKDYRHLSGAHSDLTLETIRKDNEIETLRKLNVVLSKPGKKIQPSIVTVVGFDDNECEPIEPVARSEYVKDVDYFQDKILKDKLKATIANIREMLSNIHIAQGMPPSMTRVEYDAYLRGMESMAWKMDEWATTLQGERRENLQEEENKQ